MKHALPPRHLAQWALPLVYLSRDRNPFREKTSPYWTRYDVVPEEAGGYVGVTSLILACVGIAGRRGRLVPVAEDRGSSTLTLWLWLTLLAMVLSTMPHWWPEGYKLVLKVPGMGLFRAPGRYMVLASLGVSLWAGCGLERGISATSYRMGMLVSLGLLVGSLLLSLTSVMDAGFREAQVVWTLPWRYVVTMLSWLLSLWLLWKWRRGEFGSVWVLGLCALELGGMFYFGPTSWGWSIAIPGESPMFARLARESHVGLVAGRLQNLPVRAGYRVSYPIFGITAPSPNYLLESSINKSPAERLPEEARWQRRLGVTHGIWESGDDVTGTDIIAEADDPILTAALDRGAATKNRQRWKLVRYPEHFPPVWIVTRAYESATWRALYSKLSGSDRRDEAWFLAEDRPSEDRADRPWSSRSTSHGLGVPRESELDFGPRATTAQVKEWDGRSGTIEHDGSCVLIVRRTYYPGWRVRVNEGAERAVSKVNGGLQGVVLTGRGPSRVTLRYEPTAFAGGKVLSLSAALAAIVTIAVSVTRRSFRTGILKDFSNRP
jgi:hypothetical protein